MSKQIIKQVVILVLSAVLLYFSGQYLMSISNLKSLSDGLIVMIFFFSVFPFLSLLTTLSIKFLKTILGFKNY